MVRPMPKNMFGLLEVKITAKVRKRGFTPWKAWKKQWCNLKKSVTGLELSIYNTVPIPGVKTIPMQTVSIPDTCVCYRTDSRTKPFSFGLFVDSRSRKAVMYLAGFSESNSQEWIHYIRKALDKRENSIINIPDVLISYTVSLIDNAHSRAAGLFGVYGEMTVTPGGLIIHKPNGKPKLEENLDRLCISWNQILKCHLNDKRGGEDERKICIVHTNELFPNGPGQLWIFCTQAPKLLHSIMTQCNKILTTKLTMPKQNSKCDKESLKPAECNEYNSSGIVSRGTCNYTKTPYSPCHRMSRSEGDLCGYCDTDRDSGWSSCSPPEYNSILVTTDQESLAESSMRLSISSDDSSFSLKGKVADSLISTGLLLSSLSKSAISDDFQEINCTSSIPDTFEPIDSRRISGVSIASGVYEEISESSTQNSGAKTAPLSALYEEPLYVPPPLPPRGRYASHTSDDGIGDDDCHCFTPATARSLNKNFEFSENIETFSYSSPDVNSLQDVPIRKLSVSSLNEQNVTNSIKCFENSPSVSAVKSTFYKRNSPTHMTKHCVPNLEHELKNNEVFIPRCNTEPQQSLRKSQLYSSQAMTHEETIRKIKNRFDLTPIKNKFNNFIKNHLDLDNSPKNRSHFYNSLPRSMHINKHVHKTIQKSQIHKNNNSRSCELLESNLIDSSESDKIVRSCELLDCVTITPEQIKICKKNARKGVYEDCTLNQNLNLISTNKIYQHKTESLTTSYGNCDIEEPNNTDSAECSSSLLNEPDFFRMRSEWIENKKLANLTENDYVPMSPGVLANSCEENMDYMDMTGTQIKSVSSVIPTLIN